MDIGREDNKEKVTKMALDRPAIIRWLEGKTPIKIIYVPGKIMNILA